MTKQDIIKKTEQFVKKTSEGEGTGHDFWHIVRVRNLALKIAKKEKCDLFVVELGALLHDIADWKFHQEGEGAKVSQKWLESLGVDQKTIQQVCQIVENISFKGEGEKNKITSLEGKVVQDADRLDALGAIGIARAFAYGGFKKREIYNPNIKPIKQKNAEQFKSDNGHTVNHFYEKLLLLKDLMNTKTGKEIALKRHEFLEEFLRQFYKEWEGKA